MEPKFKVPDRPSKLDPFADKLAAWLRQEVGKSRKHELTTKQLYAELAAFGYHGSYGRVAAFVHRQGRGRRPQSAGCPYYFQPFR
jgi:hypothetical protein